MLKRLFQTNFATLIKLKKKINIINIIMFFIIPNYNEKKFRQDTKKIKIKKTSVMKLIDQRKKLTR